MFQGKKILAVVPARGGSKGVKLKNLREVAGVTLVGWVGQLVTRLHWIDRAIVSTDHARIADVARAAGLDAPFLRPAELSGDRIGDWEVLHHALNAIEQIDGCRYDVILMLQPTSPMRTPQHVTDAVKKLSDEQLDSVWSVSRSDVKMHPLKQLVMAQGKLSLYDPRGEKIIARQQLQPMYHRNGLVYAFTRDCLEKQKTIYGRRIGALVIDGPVVNIDTEDDIRRVDAMLCDK